MREELDEDRQDNSCPVNQGMCKRWVRDGCAV